MNGEGLVGVLGEDDAGAGYVLAMAPCACCGAVFGFNPHKVPSIRGEPICRACIEGANVKRAERGLEPFTVLPGAYEGMPADEL